MTIKEYRELLKKEHLEFSKDNNNNLMSFTDFLVMKLFQKIP